MSEDICELQLDKLLRVDVLHAGFPCQSFSQAGNRLGFNDPRGQLFLRMMEKIALLGENKPKILVLENSPNIKVGAKGTWFSKIITVIRRSGYHISSANCAELDALQHGGSPQNRNRLFMVATLKGFFGAYNPVMWNDEFCKAEPEISTFKPSVRSILQLGQDPSSRYFLDRESKYFRMIMDKTIGPSDQRIFQLRKTVVRAKPDICPTLTANMGLGGHNVPFILDNGSPRKLMERECLRLQGFPENFEFPEGISSAAKYRMIGNSVNVPVAFVVASQIKKCLETLNE